MLSDYVCLNNKTFEIEEESKNIPVDKQLAKTISILNQKGYLVEMFSRARITKPFLIGALVHDLIEQELLVVNENTKDKIKKVINNSDYEATLICFKNEYKFDKLPTGYKLIGKNIHYNLKILKDSENIETKELIELYKEHEESIKNLEDWAIELPKNNR